MLALDSDAESNKAETTSADFPTLRLGKLPTEQGQIRPGNGAEVPLKLIGKTVCHEKNK